MRTRPDRDGGDGNGGDSGDDGDGDAGDQCYSVPTIEVNLKEPWYVHDHLCSGHAIMDHTDPYMQGIE